MSDKPQNKTHIRVSLRLAALIKKESLQVFRDPSALLIAFVLPIILLFLFAFAVSLDVDNVSIGVVVESNSSSANELASAYDANVFLKAEFVQDRKALKDGLISGRYKAIVIIPANFEQRLFNKNNAAKIQVFTDGSQPNTANFTSAYIQGVFNTWMANNIFPDQRATGPQIELIPRYWFNAQLESNRVLLPGAIAIIMTMIGTLLTALVVAREWERGTMEAMMSTPASMLEIILGKLLPYFFLGLVTTLICTFIAVVFFGLPFEGSLFALIAISSIFLLPALGQGLLISVVSKDQFVASQLALMSGFLPALLLSGFLFEISSMPKWIQFITNVIPARYYVDSLQTIFLAGDIWSQLAKDALAMVLIGFLFLGITLSKTKKSLD